MNGHDHGSEKLSQYEVHIDGPCWRQMYNMNVSISPLRSIAPRIGACPGVCLSLFTWLQLVCL